MKSSVQEVFMTALTGTGTFSDRLRVGAETATDLPPVKYAGRRRGVEQRSR